MELEEWRQEEKAGDTWLLDFYDFSKFIWLGNAQMRRSIGI